MPQLCFSNPDWELLSRGHVKAAQSIVPGYRPRGAVGLPGSRSATSARSPAEVAVPGDLSLPCQGCQEEKGVGKCFWNEAAFEKGKPTALWR